MARSMKIHILYAHLCRYCTRPQSRYTRADNVYVHYVDQHIRFVPSSRSQYASTRILATIQSCWLCQNLYVCTSILVFHRVLICADRIFFTFAIVVIDVIVVTTQRFQARRGADVSVKSHQLKICLCFALRTNSWKL